jgi:hypothetical protein
LVFKVWVGSELIKRLETDGLAPFDLLLRAGERLAEDKMLKPDRLWEEQKAIELGWSDRVRLLTAAGRAPDFLLPSEAGSRSAVLYELTASSLEIGLRLPDDSTSEFGDVIVD